MTLDTAWVRAQFPGLSDDVALFDNAGGSVPARSVVSSIHRYLREDMVQLGASYDRSVRASERVRSAYTAAAELVNGEEEGVILGASTTMNMHVVAQACAPWIRMGDEIVITEVDHEANRGAWKRLAEQRGATVRMWRLDRGQKLTSTGLEAVMTPRTRLVAFSHCANVVGAIHDARALCSTIRDRGAKSVVDGVAFAPHREVDVRSIGADLYALSLYKVYGPHLGLLYVRPEHLPSMANQNHFFVAGAGSYELMPGNVVHELAAGVEGVVEYLKELDLHHDGKGTVAGAFERIAVHEEALVTPLIDFLKSHGRVSLIGPASVDRRDRVPTVAFTVDGMASRAVVEALDPKGLAIRFGHFYAYRAMEVFDLDPDDGIVRVSMVHYNTPAEVERLVTALSDVLDA